MSGSLLLLLLVLLLVQVNNIGVIWVLMLFLFFLLLAQTSNIYIRRIVRNKWLWLVAITVLIGWNVYSQTFWGPIRFTIETEDTENFDDFYLSYGAASASMHGYPPGYQRELMVSNRNSIFIEEKIVDYYPTFFFVTICHPLYQCGAVDIFRKDVNGDLEFGRINMNSWESYMEKSAGDSKKLQSIHGNRLLSLQYHYMPYIKKTKTKINVLFYAKKIYELCVIAYKNDPDLLAENCVMSRFEGMLKYDD